MARIRITIALDNEAFTDAPELETGRILRTLAAKVEAAGSDPASWPTTARDINGNTVGSLQYIGRA